jgi:hypothetical protein
MNFAQRIKQLLEFKKQQQYQKEGIKSPLGTVANPEVVNPDPGIGTKAVMYFQDRIKNLVNNIRQTVQQPPQQNVQAKQNTPTPSPTAFSTPRPTMMPTATPTPTPAPMQPTNFKFDPSTVGVKIPAPYKFVPPTGAFAEALRRNFPKEATQAAVVGWAENASKPFDPQGYNFNTPGDKRITPGFEGSADYGQMQINNKTMLDYMRRMPEVMNSIGIQSVEDLKDPNKVAAFSAIIRKYQGWGAWKGWGNKGVTGL